MGRHTSFRSLIIIAMMFVCASPVWAGDSRPPQWYEVATGILAIPASLIGLAYSYLLIKKTRLEARKTELEIAEKERKLAQLTGGEASAVTQIITPSRENRVALLLLLRVVVMWLILSAWGIFEDTYNLLFTSALVSAQQLWHLSTSGWNVLAFVILQSLPKVAYWVVFCALGWPLFKEVNSALGIDIREFLKISSLRDLRRVTDLTAED